MSWALMPLAGFLRFCRRAARLCIFDGRQSPSTTSSALAELMDIALRVHQSMERTETAGADGIRFQVRMYLHLQFASRHRVLHTGAAAMLVFRGAVDDFVRRIGASPASSSWAASAPRPVASAARARVSSPPAPRSAHTQRSAAPAAPRRWTTCVALCCLVPRTHGVVPRPTYRLWSSAVEWKAQAAVNA